MQQQKQPEKQPDPIVSFTMPGCLSTLILAALLCFTIKECKRADLRLQRDKIRFEQMVDTIKQR